MDMSVPNGWGITPAHQEPQSQYEESEGYYVYRFKDDGTREYVLDDAGGKFFLPSMHDVRAVIYTILVEEENAGKVS